VEVAAIVDWEECLSTLAPHWELSIALHDLSIDEKHILLEGYGMDGSTFEQMAPLITAFNIVNYYGPIRAAVEQGDDKTVAQFKLRLRGSLDLYSLPARGRGATAVF
jgi:hygromycin-B 4-O-kinase